MTSSSALSSRRARQRPTHRTRITCIWWLHTTIRMFLLSTSRRFYCSWSCRCCCSDRTTKPEMNCVCVRAKGMRRSLQKLFPSYLYRIGRTVTTVCASNEQQQPAKWATATTYSCECELIRSHVHSWIMNGISFSCHEHIIIKIAIPTLLLRLSYNGCIYYQHTLL